MYTLIHNIRVYGKNIGLVTTDQMASMSLTTDIALHITRHYRMLPQSYVDSLIGQHYSGGVIAHKDITKALTTAGSKFCDNLHDLSLETPRQMFEFTQGEAIKQAANQETVWMERGGIKDAVFIIKMPQPIGERGLIPIAELSKEEKKRMIVRPRGSLKDDNIKVNVVYRSEIQLTHQLIVHICFDSQKDQLTAFTAYPGYFAATFPSVEQSKEEYAYNKKYWQSQVFVELA